MFSITNLIIFVHREEKIFDVCKQTRKAQTSLRICADWSAPLFLAYSKVSYLNLLKPKLKFFSYSDLLVGNPQDSFSRRGLYDSDQLFNV